MSIKSFRSQTANDVFLGDNTKHARKLPTEVWTATVRRLDMLHSAVSLKALAAIPGLHLQKMDADHYRIRINNKYRIAFRFEDGDVFDVEIEEAED
jgi:proteic killer suppression protein